jgi:threonine/homoserine/homoserine lactone efflux protein
VLEVLIAFVPVAALLTITPGAGTAMIVRTAARGGRRDALLCTLGNSVGVLGWALLAAVGVAAVVAASAEAFAVVKLVGAAALLIIGLASLLRPRAGREAHAAPRRRAALRDGLLTSVANPKLAVFYSALFPQFVPEGTPILPAALAMAAMAVTFDLVWYSALAYAVTRARTAFVQGPWARRVERLTGAVLVGLGVRLALERRAAQV